MPQPAARVLTAAAPETLLAQSGHAALQPNTVHVWAFALDGPEPFVALCRSVLSDEERHRADRFVFDRDRVHYTVAHAVLRHLLSRYRDQSPESLRFSTTPTGKPALWAGSEPTPPICFNLSHSEDRAMLGVSAGRELGVDLERVRSNIEALAISRHYFFGSERAAIESAPPDVRDNVFFRYWVAKEAVLKAQGIGLGFPLDRFRVEFLQDGDRARIETLDPDKLDGAWTVRMLPGETGWPAAVAARGEDWDIAIESL
jgi:4'-phosphopantetheinyl transferase